MRSTIPSGSNQSNPTAPDAGRRVGIYAPSVAGCIIGRWHQSGCASRYHATVNTDCAVGRDTANHSDCCFVAVDVETANASLASICEIGMVSFASTGVVEGWQTLVNPGDRFDPVNVSIHGIDESAVNQAPRFPDVAPRISALLHGKTVVSHMAFDRVALNRACEKHNLPSIDCTWLDTARVCRRAWPKFARRGYGLAAIASWCGIQFDHHRAQEDARAAGSILLCAVSATGLSVSDWVVRSRQPIGPYGLTAGGARRW
jgi:DNA polymerase III epsilon subunit-like protein